MKGWDEFVIPIEPAMTNYHIKIPTEGKMIQQTVKRRQFPLTGAYAFMDYQSQGQTILYVIATPGLSLFSLYVSLSHSSGRDTIRLLRDFDNRIFEKQHDTALIEKEARLLEMDRKMKDWLYDQKLYSR